MESTTARISLAVPAAHWPGVASAVVVAAVASTVGWRAPVVGAPVIAIALGTAVGIAAGRRRRAALARGVHHAATWPLQAAVALTGWQLSLGRIAATGGRSLPVMLGTLGACLLVAALVGRRLGVPADLRTLIGVGTAICGASAIAAVSPVIRARSAAISYAVTTIFVFNVVAVLVFPVLGHALGMSQHAFGLFAGTAVNDTSSVVAAATSYGHVAASDAVIVKLTRVLMIIPVTLTLAVVTARRDGVGGVRPHPLRLVPWFLVTFLGLATLNSVWSVPDVAHRVAQDSAGFLIATALAAIGLGTDVAGIRRAGTKPLLMGAVLWLTVTTTSLALQGTLV